MLCVFAAALVEWPVFAFSADKLVELHNDERVKHGRAKLEKDDKLSQYAQEWADTMARRGRMTHSSMKNIMALGFANAGENIAWGQDDEQEVMSAWMHSPGHRRNILSGTYKQIGCGVAETGRGPYWCTCFGVRK